MRVPPAAGLPAQEREDNEHILPEVGALVARRYLIRIAESSSLTSCILLSHLATAFTRSVGPTGSMVPSRRVTTECAWEVAA